MKIRSKLLKSLAIASLLLPLFLFTEEEDHVAVGTRPATITSEEPESPEKVECDFIFNQNSSSSSSIHWLTHLTTSNSTAIDSAEIEDGSVWKFNAYDGSKAFSWLSPKPLNPNDPYVVIPLTVAQNSSWFSSYKYKLINKNSGESIEANLKLGPLKDNPYSRFITVIDFKSQIVILNDNSRYEISSSDSKAFRDWALFDYVIKGENRGWGSSYESLLINVNMDNYARAREI